MADIPDIELSKLGETNYGAFRVEVVDPVADYLELFEVSSLTISVQTSMFSLN